MNAKRQKALQKTMTWAILVIIAAAIVVVALAIGVFTSANDETAEATEPTMTPVPIEVEERLATAEETPAPEPELPVTLIPVPIETEDVEPMELAAEEPETTPEPVIAVTAAKSTGSVVWSDYAYPDGSVRLSEFLEALNLERTEAPAGHIVYQTYGGNDHLDFVLKADGYTVDHTELYAQHPSATAAAMFYPCCEPTYMRSLTGDADGRHYVALIDDQQYAISLIDLMAIYQMWAHDGYAHFNEAEPRAFITVPTDFSKIVVPGGETEVDWQYLYDRFGKDWFDYD